MTNKCKISCRPCHMTLTSYCFVCLFFLLPLSLSIPEVDHSVIVLLELELNLDACTSSLSTLSIPALVTYSWHSKYSDPLDTELRVCNGQGRCECGQCICDKVLHHYDVILTVYIIFMWLHYYVQHFIIIYTADRWGVKIGVWRTVLSVQPTELPTSQRW